MGGVAMHPVVYPNGDACEYLNVWRAVGGEARVNDDESTQVGWFTPDGLPELDDWARLRIETTLTPRNAAWYAPPGQRHPALTQPHAL
jgi:8-oxo-dGTP diphosphatase